MECTAKAGFYGWPGQAAQECPWNFFCPQGVTQPAACPVGTRADPGMDHCIPGSQMVVLYDWIAGVTWIALFLTGLTLVGFYRKVLFTDKGQPPHHIKIKIAL